MFQNAALHALLFVMGMMSLKSTSADQKSAILNDIAISWRGEGDVQLSPEPSGTISVRCECRGEVRIRGRGFEAHAQHLVYDSARRTLILEGKVLMKVRAADDQKIVGDMRADRVTVRVADDQWLMESVHLQGGRQICKTSVE